MHNPETHLVPLALLRARRRVTMPWEVVAVIHLISEMDAAFPCHQGCEAATGRKIEMQFSGRRERDLPELLSESKKARKHLDYIPILQT